LKDSTKAFDKYVPSLAEKLGKGKSVMLGADDFTVYSEIQRHFNRCDPHPRVGIYISFRKNIVKSISTAPTAKAVEGQ
jgi:hypothetical protein